MRHRKLSFACSESNTTEILSTHDLLLLQVTSLTNNSKPQKRVYGSQYEDEPIYVHIMGRNS